MDCNDLNTWPVWAVVIMAVLSHAHGTASFAREAFSVVSSLIRQFRK